MPADVMTTILTVIVGPVVVAILTGIGVLFTRQEARHQRELESERAKSAAALAKVDAMAAEQIAELRQFRSAYIKQLEVTRQAFASVDTNTRVIQGLAGQP
jgi:uncharacterized membrane protein